MIQTFLLDIFRRFDINLQTDPFDSADIILHMSCRVKEKVFVLNTKERNEWGKEEKHKCNLEKGIPFSIRIRCHENRFEVNFANLLTVLS